LENDMSAIRAEHEAQDRILHQQRSALHNVVAGLTALRLIGKDPDASDGVDSPMPAADDREDGEDAGGVASTLAPSSLLNPTARPFVPPSRTSTPGDSQRKPGLSMPTPLSSGTPLSRVSSPLPPPANSTSKDNDIEMGEVDEKRGRKKKIREEELEEGEATDGSSELSDPPGD
jgi:THO complex subunit 7